MVMAGVALWHCIPNATKTAVPALISGFFLHLRVVRSAPTGELRVLFTDIIRSFRVGNTGWKVHLAHRFPNARKIYVQEGDNAPGEYVSLSLADFGLFVRWAHRQSTNHPARDKSIKTFQKTKPKHVAARAFMQQVHDLLFAFGQLHPSPSPSPSPSAPQPPPSLVSFLLGHQYIREATFSCGGLCEVKADKSLGAALALSAFQLELQLTTPEEKEQEQKQKAATAKVNVERKNQGKGPLRNRQSKVKDAQVGPQIGNKKGRGKQRERAPAAVEAVQPLQIQLPFHLPVTASPDEEEEEEEDVFDDEEKNLEAEDSEAEDEDDEDNNLPPFPPQSPTRDEPQPPLRDTAKAPEHSGLAGYVFPLALPSSVPAVVDDLLEPLPPHSPLPDPFDLEFDDDALGQMHPSALHGDAMEV